MERLNEVDSRIQKWGEKIASSKGNRKTFAIQLDWFSDHELIRTIAELKSKGMFTQCFRLSVQMFAPFMLYGDTEGVLQVGSEAVVRQDVMLPESSEAKLLREVRNLAEAMSLGLRRISSDRDNAAEDRELPSAIQSDAIEEMMVRQEQMMDEIKRLRSQMLEGSLSSSGLGQSSQNVEAVDDSSFDNAFDFSDLEDDDDFSDDVGEFSLDDLMVDKSERGESASRTMLKSFISAFGSDGE